MSAIQLHGRGDLDSRCRRGRLNGQERRAEGSRLVKLQGVDNDAHLETLCWCQTASIELLNWRGKRAAGDESRHGTKVAQLHGLDTDSGRPDSTVNGRLGVIT